MEGANGPSPGPGTGPSISAASEIITQSIESPSQTPFGHLSDRRELLPPISADSFSMGHPDHQPHPRPNDHDSRVMEAAQSMATLPQVRHFQHTTGYPSPTASASDTAGRGLTAPSLGVFPQVMPPPYSVSTPAKYVELDTSPERPAKRVRLSPRNDVYQSHDGIKLHRASSLSPNHVNDLARPSYQPHTPRMISPGLNTPMTPASSSSNSDEARQTSRLASTSRTVQDSDVRRVSVSSLLSGSLDLEHARNMSANTAQALAGTITLSPSLQNGSPPGHRVSLNMQTDNYGLDRGLPDLDIPRNNDTVAINGISPSEHSDLEAWLESVDLGVPEFGFGLQKREFVFAKGGYYASPVPILIPRNLEPLPSTLLENPMNLLYFHHFLNHTAKILVVHDCSQNPFRTILPQSKPFYHLDPFTAS